MSLFYESIMSEQGGVYCKTCNWISECGDKRRGRVLEEVSN